MKIKYLFVVAFLCAFSINSFAQVKVTITPNKVTYKRTGEDVPDHKKTFEVTYPKITGNGDIAAIEKTISYWTNYETDLAEVTEDQFVSDLTYKVNYNNKGILDISLIMSGSAAYPSDFVKNLIVNLETGERVKIKDAFQNRTGLYNKIAMAHQNEIKMTLAKKKEEGLKVMLAESDTYYSVYEIEEFSVSDKGVTFIFDYGFPHVALALQPEGRYFFTWDQLKSYVAEYGSLGVFLPKVSK